MLGGHSSFPHKDLRGGSRLWPGGTTGTAGSHGAARRAFTSNPLRTKLRWGQVTVRRPCAVGTGRCLQHGVNNSRHFWVTGSERSERSAVAQSRRKQRWCKWFSDNVWNHLFLLLIKKKDQHFMHLVRHPLTTLKVFYLSLAWQSHQTPTSPSDGIKAYLSDNQGLLTWAPVFKSYSAQA